MKQITKKAICIVLLIVTFALMAGMLTACNSGNWVYVTYYYNDELLEQEKYWQYHWSLHGDNHKDDLDWDKDSNDVLKTIKKLCNKLYLERGKKVFFAPKDFLDGKLELYKGFAYEEYTVYSYSYGECWYNRITNKLDSSRSWNFSMEILKTNTRDNYILVAKDEP